MQWPVCLHDLLGLDFPISGKKVVCLPPGTGRGPSRGTLCPASRAQGRSERPHARSFSRNFNSKQSLCQSGDAASDDVGPRCPPDTSADACGEGGPPWAGTGDPRAPGSPWGARGTPSRSATISRGHRPALKPERGTARAPSCPRVTPSGGGGPLPHAELRPAHSSMSRRPGYLGPLSPA